MVDDLSNIQFKPTAPLPSKNFAFYLVGGPGSGKTNLLMALLMSKPTKKRPDKPRYYNRFFDTIHLISGSLQTLPDKVIKGLPEGQVFNKYSDETLNEIITKLAKGPNTNNLIVLDDSIKELTRSKTLAAIFFNRRHLTQSGDPEDKHSGGLSIWTTSQKYTLLPLEVRLAQSHYFLFRMRNATEIKRIKEELMTDLSPEEQDEILEIAWEKPHSFLMLDMDQPRESKYYVNFDLIKVD